MTDKLIMPKGDGQLLPCIYSLKIYYKLRYSWVSNEEFKKDIAKLLSLPADSDGPFLIKKSEAARYFGLIEYDFRSRKGKITERGVKFYEASQINNKPLMIDLIMESINQDSFGRNNSATKTSNSDIDPPKLVLKAAYDIPKLNKNEIAYLLYSMHDRKDSYKNTSDKILANRGNNWSLDIPSNLYNKYTDLKFRVFFQNVGIIEDNSRYIEISDYIFENFTQEIEKISVYNTDSATLLGMERVDDDNIENEILQKIPIYEEEKLQTKNNRKPFLDSSTRENTRYSTDYRLSKTALANASFMCEFDNTHKTFKTKYNINYMEAHHLFPMKEQKNYLDINFDRTENIVSLCPVCHRAIHYSEVHHRNKIIQHIFQKRKTLLENVGIKFDNDILIEMYN